MALLGATGYQDLPEWRATDKGPRGRRAGPLAFGLMFQLSQRRTAPEARYAVMAKVELAGTSLNPPHLAPAAVVKRALGLPA
jgi:hypothetical protein